MTYVMGISARQRLNRKKPIWLVKHRASRIHFQSVGKSFPNGDKPWTKIHIVETNNIEMFLNKKKSRRAQPFAIARLKKIDETAVPRA